jgi:glycogen debranching enzyme
VASLLEHPHEAPQQRADIYQLAEDLKVELNALLPLTEAAELLGFATIAQGLARYGLEDPALQIWTVMFETGLYSDLHRMPELFCDFPQAPGEGPTRYPVACVPQSWSAASVFLLSQACLGLEINGPEAQVYFTRPHLPISLGELRIHNF